MLKNISPAIFGIALLFFLLPWVELSCQGHKVVSVNGFQLATGTTIERQKTKGEALAVIALLSTIAGLILCFLKHRMKNLILIVVSGLGTIMLLLLRVKLDGDILREGRGMVQLNYNAGYYLTLLSFLSVIGINAYSKYGGGKKLPYQALTGVSSYKFCSECGSKNPVTNTFCSECGTKFD